MKKRGKKKKRVKGNEDNLRDLWDNVKYPNIRIIGEKEKSSQKKTERKAMRKYLRR